jgi:hypothetical protein
MANLLPLSEGILLEEVDRLKAATTRIRHNKNFFLSLFFDEKEPLYMYSCKRSQQQANPKYERHHPAEDPCDQ